MYRYKINKRGQITIPKYIRDKHGFVQGISFYFCEREREIIIYPVCQCCSCGKALPDELIDRGACLSCPPPKITVLY